MTRERIEDMREVVLPFVKKRLLETNYEGLGEDDAKEFEREFTEILELAIKALEQEPRWISVKDRLPQKGEYGDVLVTFIPTAGALWATVMIARYSDLMGIAKPCFHIGEVGKESFENITPQVTAWMPLPSPYKRGEDE